MVELQLVLENELLFLTKNESNYSQETEEDEWRKSGVTDFLGRFFSHSVGPSFFFSKKKIVGETLPALISFHQLLGHLLPSSPLLFLFMPTPFLI